MLPKDNVPTRTAKCPNCSAARVHQFRPFCSKGCRDRDLIGWFDEAYVIAGRQPAEEGENRDGAAPVDDSE
jgi:uncharacterized protein